MDARGFSFCSACDANLRANRCAGCGGALLASVARAPLRSFHASCLAAFGGAPAAPAVAIPPRLQPPSALGEQPPSQAPCPFPSAAAAASPLHAALAREARQREQLAAARRVPSPPRPPAPRRPPFHAASLEGVLRRAQALGLVRERPWRFRAQRRCLLGRDLVDFLCGSGQCRSRRAAVEVGQALLERGLLAPLEAGGGGAPRFEDLAEAHYEVVGGAAAARTPGAQSGGGGSEGVARAASFASATPPFGAAASPPAHRDTALSAAFGADGEEEEHVSVSARLGGGELIPPPWGEEAAAVAAAREGAGGGAAKLGGGAEWGAGSPPPPRSPAGGPPPLPPSAFASFVARVSRSFSSVGRFRSASLAEAEGGGGEGAPAAEPPPRPRGGSGGSAVWSGSDGAAGGGGAAAELERVLWYAGWLSKRGHVGNTGFKRRWFVLQGSRLAYYRSGPRDEAAAAAAAAAAVAAAIAKTQRGHAVAAAAAPAAVLPPSAEEPAGTLDIRCFSAEAAAMEKSLLALRLVSKTAELEYVVTAETERDFVAWVKALTLCRVAWESVKGSA
jgi:hypothetical protein